jgi:mitochondrial fission protein ELM1
MSAIASHLASGELAPKNTVPLTWIITDNGKTGTENQALGLANALNLQADVFSVAARPILSWIPRRHWRSWCVSLVKGQLLCKPWPKILITAGRVATGLGASLKRSLGSDIFHIALMNPRLPECDFDVIISPAHDGLHGPRVVETRLSIHNLSPQLLIQEAARFEKNLPSLPVPRLGVLLGGSTRSFFFSTQFAQKLAEDLKKIAQSHKVTPYIIPSRRTPPAAIKVIAQHLRGVPHYVWDGTGDNPYLGILGLSDYLMVTGDSVQMLSEAADSATPLYVYPLPYTPDRLKTFHTYLFNKAIARPFTDTLEHWARKPQNDHPALIENLKVRLNAFDSTLFSQDFRC